MVPGGNQVSGVVGLGAWCVEYQQTSPDTTGIDW